MDGPTWAPSSGLTPESGVHRSGSTSQIQTITGVTALAGGHRHSLAATQAGAAHGWGLNNLGQVGDGTTTTRTTPVAIANLSNVEPGPSLHATYTYNGDGLRTAKTVNGTTTTFTWDHANGLPLLLTDGTNNYIYGPAGLPLTQIASDGTTNWFHQDQIGSTRALSDNTGATVATYTYDAYGSQTQQTGTASAGLGYAGEYTDTETDFIYLRARYYDPSTNQFLTRDPIEPITRDAYGYASNDPLNGVDPAGLCNVGPVRIGVLSRADGSCKGNGVVDDVKDYGDDVAAYAGGVATGCALFAWTGVGAVCAGVATGVSTAAGTAHTIAECLDDGFLQADCVWSAGQLGLSGATLGASSAVRGAWRGSGAIMRAVSGAAARLIDVAGGIYNGAISLERTGWYNPTQTGTVGPTSALGPVC